MHKLALQNHAGVIRLLLGKAHKLGLKERGEREKSSHNY